MFTLQQVNISVVNVLGNGVAGGLTYAIINSGVNSGPKTMALLVGSNMISMNEVIPGGPVFELTLEIKNDSYATLKCAIRISTQTEFRWNHRNVTVSIAGGVLTVRAILIRVRQAPIALITKKLKAAVVAAPDKSVAPFVKDEGLDENNLNTGVWNDPDSNVRQYWGLESLDIAQTIRTIKNENGAPIKTADADGWGRFFFEDTSITLRNEGGFLWLEYGAVDSALKSEPRFLVGLWVPKGSAGKPLDVIVSLGHSPTAWGLPGTNFPYRSGPYPYSINKADSFTPGHPQGYTHFGLSYFFETSNFSFHFASQSVASQKNALIVMPIIPMETKQGFGAPFTSQQGLYRLLLEIKQFLVQEGFSDIPKFSFANWQGKTAKTGSLDNINLDGSIFIAAAPKPLTLGNITVCGHSSGIVLLTTLISTKALGNTTNYPFEQYGARESEFEALWKEIWDLDISHKDAMAIDDYIKLVLTWYKRGNRVLRMYRSQHTFSTISSFDEIIKLTTSKESKAKGAAAANYWHNANEDLSLMTLNNGYTTTTQSFPGILPRFLGPGEPWWRYHQAPMILGFGHACKMRVSS